MAIIIDVSQLNSRHEAPKLINENHDEIILDFSNISNVQPLDLVHLKCIIDHALLSKCEKRMLIFPRDEGVRNYCGRLGMFEGIPTYTYPLNKLASSNFIELQKIFDDDNDHIASKVISSMESCSLPTAGIGTDLHNVLTEVANNVFYHSGAVVDSGWGYFAAQYYLRLKKFEFAFCDVGVGFKQSYTRAGKLMELQSDAIILKSFERHVTSINDPVRGIGLNEMLEFITQYNGEITIQSHDGFVYLGKNGNIIKRLNPNPFLGTLVNFRFNI